ncbi:MAG: FAD:protein FMN transferase [Anaerolineales bacterium]
MDTFNFRAMNTNILLAAQGSSKDVEEGFQRAQQYIEASERRFTRFSESSELSHLNQSNGTWIHASAEMTFVLSLAKQYNEQTSGLFNPAILPNLEQVGYDRSMDLIRAEGAQLPSIRFATDPGLLPLDGLLIDPDENLIFLPHGMRLDLGGIAKGWIAEQAALVLAEHSQACLVDAGGDIFMVRLPEGEPAWQIDLEDPLNPGRCLTSLNVPSGALTTSSVVKRKWMQGETPRHHLIDPRTGLPAETDWLSVTVFAPHADKAEVFAKALLIAGPQEVEIVAHNAPEISYLAVDRGGKIWGSLESLELING